MKKLILYGAGKIGQNWLEKLGDKNVYAFADSSSEENRKTMEQKLNKLVIGKKELLDLQDSIQIFISTGVSVKEQILQQLNSYGLGKNIISSPYSEDILRCHVTSCFDPKCEFEGNNFIGGGGVLTNSKLGFSSYIAGECNISNAKIGRFCSIACRVSLIAGTHPTKKWVSTHPSFFSSKNIVTNLHFSDVDLFKEREYLPDGLSIHIGNDVWIGADVKILEGVKIGDGAIIAAGAVVTKDVEPYSIVGGVPAKKIRDRFTTKQIEFLLKLKWWNKDLEWIKKHANLFRDIDLLMEKLNE